MIFICLVVLWGQIFICLVAVTRSPQGLLWKIRWAILLLQEKKTKRREWWVLCGKNFPKPLSISTDPLWPLEKHLPGCCEHPGQKSCCGVQELSCREMQTSVNKCKQLILQCKFLLWGKKNLTWVLIQIVFFYNRYLIFGYFFLIASLGAFFPPVLCQTTWSIIFFL